MCSSQTAMIASTHNLGPRLSRGLLVSPAPRVIGESLVPIGCGLLVHQDPGRHRLITTLIVSGRTAARRSFCLRLSNVRYLRLCDALLAHGKKHHNVSGAEAG